MRDDMSIYNYSIFETVVEQSSFVKAANILNLTPSAISHAIAKLESDFGFMLFVRSKTGVYLTGEGEKIYPHIKAILKEEEYLNHEVAQIHDIESGIISIGAFSSVTVHWLPEIIKTFREKHPKIEIRVFTGGYDKIQEWIANRSVDIAFISDKVLPDNVDFIPLHKDPIVFVLPKDFKPHKNNYVTVDDVQYMNFVMQLTGDNQETVRIIKKYKLNVNFQFHIKDDNSIIAMVEAGFGISALPKLVCKGISRNVNICKFIPDEYRIIGLVCPSSHYISPATQKMKEHIIEFINKNNLSNV